ncbi:unnamed protein product, partial [Trichogramma brassicae]
VNYDHTLDARVERPAQLQQRVKTDHYTFKIQKSCTMRLSVNSLSITICADGFKSQAFLYKLIKSARKRNIQIHGGRMDGRTWPRSANFLQLSEQLEQIHEISQESTIGQTRDQTNCNWRTASERKREQGRNREKVQRGTCAYAPRHYACARIRYIFFLCRHRLQRLEHWGSSPGSASSASAHGPSYYTSKAFREICLYMLPLAPNYSVYVAHTLIYGSIERKDVEPCELQTCNLQQALQRRWKAKIEREKERKSERETNCSSYSTYELLYQAKEREYYEGHIFMSNERRSVMQHIAETICRNDRRAYDSINARPNVLEVGRLLCYRAPSGRWCTRSEEMERAAACAHSLTQACYKLQRNARGKLFSLCRVQKMNDDTWVTCPYNVAHRALKSRFQFHLTKCRTQHNKGDKKQCPYDANHIINVLEFEYHLTACESRESVLHFQSTDQDFELNLLPVPTRPLVQYHSEEDWDAEGDVASYQPLKNIADRPVFIQPTGLAPAERKSFRRNERGRHQKIENRGNTWKVKSRKS